MTHRPRHALLGAVALLTLAACSSTRSVSGSSTPVSGVETVAPESTIGGTAESTASTDAETTTAPPTTLAAPTTTAAPAPAPLTLRGDGIGTFDIGSDVVAVHDALVARLGEPSADEAAEYPTGDGSGGYTSSDGEIGFIAPFGRELCWSIGFCAEFAGASPAAMTLAGWHYNSDTTGALKSSEGVTIGSSWADFPTMDVQPGGCYSSGGGTIGTIRLSLVSTGTPFSEFDASGNYIEHLPAPTDVTVGGMDAGANPTFLAGDC